MNLSRPFAHLALVIAAASVLAGCTSLTPRYDTRFGDAVRQVRLDMTLDPEAGLKDAEDESLDGTAAQQAISRYRSASNNQAPASASPGGITTVP